MTQWYWHSRAVLPQVYNIESDPHEDLNVGGINSWPLEFSFKAVKTTLEMLKSYPNPPRSP